MRRLIVNADDFGLSPGVSEGILEAHVNGIVTSTSLMVRAPAAAAAAQDARAFPGLSVGLHFVEEADADLDDPRQAEAELRAQLERFGELTGTGPTHVDSHHHVHTTRDRMVAFRRVVEPLGIPLRRDGRIAYIGGFYGQWQEGVTELHHISREYLVELVRTEALEGYTELACHPGRLLGDFRSSYYEERAVELASLTAPGLKAEIETLGVELVGFRDWP